MFGCYSNVAPSLFLWQSCDTISRCFESFVPSYNINKWATLVPETVLVRLNSFLKNTLQRKRIGASIRTFHSGLLIIFTDWSDGLDDARVDYSLVMPPPPSFTSSKGVFENNSINICFSCRVVTRKIDLMESAANIFVGHLISPWCNFYPYKMQTHSNNKLEKAIPFFSLSLFFEFRASS